METATAMIEPEQAKKGDVRLDHCSRHGEFKTVYHPGLVFGREGWTGCDSCRREYEDALKEAGKRRDERRRVVRCLTSSDVPRRYRRKSLKTFIPQGEDQQSALRGAESYVENFPEHLRVCRCLSFIGPPGVGKSHLACGTLLGLAERGYSVRYTTASELIYEIRGTQNYKFAEQSTKSLLDELCNRDYYTLLLIDDVGCVSTEAEHLRYIIDRRYNNELPTMITSNMGTEELATFINFRGLDRLRENGGLMFALSGTSRRANAESTVIDRPAWWEKYLSQSASVIRELEEEEDDSFSVRMQDYPGL